MENKSITVLKWSVALLMIMNVILMVNGFHKQAPPPPPIPQGLPGPAHLITEKLQLNAEQQKKFHELKDEHRSIMRQLDNEGREIRHAYFELLKSDSVNETKKQEMELLISDNQKLIEQATFNHFKKVRAICDDKQKEKFDASIQDILRSMKMQPPPPHPVAPLPSNHH